MIPKVTLFFSVVFDSKKHLEIKQRLCPLEVDHFSHPNQTKIKVPNVKSRVSNVPNARANPV